MASLFAKISQASSLITAVRGLVTVPRKTVIHNIVIDCVHSEIIDYSNAITEHPIATKSSISDHVYRQPVIVVIDGTITDSNFRIFGVIEQPLQQNSLQTIVANAKNLISLSSQKPSEAAFKSLTTLSEEKALISVATKYKVYDDMVIEKLTIKNDNTTSHRLLFSCVLKQLTFATVQQSYYTPKTLLKPVSKPINKGLQQATDSKEKQVNNDSWLYKGGVKLKEFILNPSTLDTVADTVKYNP